MATRTIYDMIDTWNDAGLTFTGIKMNVTDTASLADSKIVDLQINNNPVLQVNKDKSVSSWGEFRINKPGSDVTNYERGFARWNVNVFEIGVENNGTGLPRAITLMGTNFVVDNVGNIVLGGASATGTKLMPTTSQGTYANPVLSLATGNASALAAFRAIKLSTQQGYAFNDDLGAGDKLWHSGGRIVAINAVQSAYVPLQGKLTTDTNAVAETPAATHTLLMYDATGTAYKVLAVAA